MPDGIAPINDIDPKHCSKMEKKLNRSPSPGPSCKYPLCTLGDDFDSTRRKAAYKVNGRWVAIIGAYLCLYTVLARRRWDGLLLVLVGCLSALLQLISRGCPPSSYCCHITPTESLASVTSTDRNSSSITSSYLAFHFSPTLLC